MALFTLHPSPFTAFGGQWPSVFRGVVVADSPLGVRVVSVEESSQAYLADLRPEDLIIQIQGKAVHSIDEFAMRSNTLKAERAIEVTVLVFRNGIPRELHLHLSSYPILHEWGISFIPDFDLRFGEPRTGLDYWRRLGRGFEEAGKPHEALNAYLNGLHNVPTDPDTAVKVTELFSLTSQGQLEQDQLAEGLASLRQATLMMEKLFDYALTDAQLHALKRQLEDTLRTLRHMPGRPPLTTSRLGSGQVWRVLPLRDPIRPRRAGLSPSSAAGGWGPPLRVTRQTRPLPRPEGLAL